MVNGQNQRKSIFDIIKEQRQVKVSPFVTQVQAQPRINIFQAIELQKRQQKGIRTQTAKPVLPERPRTTVVTQSRQDFFKPINQATNQLRLFFQGFKIGR